MNIYVITFQMLTEERTARMVTLIKEQSSWARITDTTWCVKTEISKSSEMREWLANRVDIQRGERLIIINITHSAWASYNLPKEVADWLKA